MNLVLITLGDAVGAVALDSLGGGAVGLLPAAHLCAGEAGKEAKS